MFFLYSTSALSGLKIVPHPNPLPGGEGALLYPSHQEKGGRRRGEAQELQKILINGSMQNPNRTLLKYYHNVSEIKKSKLRFNNQFKICRMKFVVNVY